MDQSIADLLFPQWHPASRPPNMGDDSDESDDLSYFGDSSDEDETRLRLTTRLAQMPNRTTKGLNYTTSYVKNWGCDEAFRESYQNWRDGILRSFHIDLADFRTVYTEDRKKRVILVAAPHPITHELLGFIRFQYDKDGLCKGGLKMANFNASLEYGTLGTGATTKAGDKKQTGQHGEGMKLSALVFRRSNYNFRIESGGYNWRFIFKGGELACSLSRIGEATLKKVEKKVKNEPRTTITRPWTDVCVVIGGPGASRDIDGRHTQGRRPHVDEFKKWLEVTLDIRPPADMVRTVEGDLIRDPRYQGCMFLRGLRLPSGGIRGENYRYGYNFLDGSTTRDRDSLAGAGKESTKIAAIWAAAIRADNSGDSAITDEYTNLLLNHLNDKGDAMLNSDSNPLPEDIARKVWANMRVMNHDEQGRQAFYYRASEGKDQVHIIEKSLKRNAVPLHAEMWKMLEAYELCRAPKEELLHRFKTANVVEIPGDTFAQHVYRMLCGLLRSAPATKHMALTFVDGEHLQINAALLATKWRIHNKWLTYEGAHENTFCEEPQSQNNDPFCCDHAIHQLWDILISQLMASGDHPAIAAGEAWLKGMARSRLSQMPRSVECMTTDRKGQLSVTWKSVDSHLNKDKQVKVVLHSIAHIEGDTSPQAPANHRLQPLNDANHSCNDCRSQFAPTVSEGVTFTDLDPQRYYYPVVSRHMEGAIRALHPAAIKPRGSDLVTMATSPMPVIATVERSLSNNINAEVGDTSAVPASEDYDVNSNSNADDVANDDVNDDMDDNDSLYRPPTSTPPRSRPRPRTPQVAAPAMDFAGAHQPHTKDRAAQTEASLKPEAELHILGAKIQHNALDWGGSFPGSHDFYRTRSAPDQEVFIVKPKVDAIRPTPKRVMHNQETCVASKKSRVSTKSPQAGSSAVHVPSRPLIPQSP